VTEQGVVIPVISCARRTLGHSRRPDRQPLTSGLPRSADIFGDRRHVAKVPRRDMLVWRRHIQVQGVHCLTPALLRSGFIDGGWPASTLWLDRSPAPSDVAAWRDADGASAGSGRGRTGCRRADWSRPRRQTSRDAARSSQSGYKRHPDVRSALAAADGSNLEDLDEPAIDTRDPPANAAFALPEVLDGLAHAAAGEARKAYDAFDRHYGTARWVLRFVLASR
jgi:hypothetical protein